MGYKNLRRVFCRERPAGTIAKIFNFCQNRPPKDTELSHFSPKILVNSALMRLYEI